MLEIIKQELIDNNEDYIVTKNGEVIFRSNDKLSLEFSNNVDLKVIHIIDKDTKISYKVKKNINIKLSEVFYDLKNSPIIEIEFNLEEGSKFDYTSLRRSGTVQDIKAIVNAYVKFDAYLNYKTLTTHVGDGTIDENFHLENERALVDVKNVLINTSKKKQDFNVNIYHNAKNTISNLLNYGICKNESYLTINSKGIIIQGAHKAEIRQRAKGLLLDEYSVLSANPLLEIDDFDVIANHGASIGAIDEDELYYLMSRGLTKDESEKLIVAGFINPVLAEVKEGKFQDYCLAWINSNL